KEPHLAGRWYPAAPAELARRVEELLGAGGSPRPGVVAVVVPHAAYEYSGPTAARAFAAAGAGVRRAIVLAPSHFAGFRGAALLPMRGYRTPLGVVPIDAEAAAALARASLVRPNPALFMREHAVEISSRCSRGWPPSARSCRSSWARSSPATRRPSPRRSVPCSSPGRSWSRART